MTPLLEALTDREEEVALLFGDGLSYGQIAARLGLTDRQVKRAAENARRRLDKPNMAAVAVHVTRLRAAVR